MDTAQEVIAEDEFDLRVTVVEAGAAVAELLRNTDDNCGATCQSACTSCSKA
jgi:FxLD family lantipeptide